MHILDWALIAYLLLGLPAYNNWKAWRKQVRAARPGPAAAPESKYLGTLIAALIPLTTLVLVFAWTGRSPRLLGLDIPPPAFGTWALLVAIVLLAWFYADHYRSERRMTEQEREDYLGKLAGVESTPRTRSEFWQFALLALCVGAGWELLFRGYLMLVLPPLVGTAGAVILAALAYGIGHKFKSVKMLIASIVSALLFTIGYVLTNSLWWLMLVHVGLMLNSLADYRFMRKYAVLMPA